MKRHIILVALLLCSFGAYSQQITEEEQRATDAKLNYLINYIRYNYVDKTDLTKITEKGIVSMLKELDPHSVYISKDEVQKANEPLVGNFDGVGVSFQITDDTIRVIDVIRGGPSEKVGVMPSDKILKVDSAMATGDSIKNDWVYKHLRGNKGTKVAITILRPGRSEPIVFNIIRDKIPIKSINTYFMLDKEIGYILLDRFAQSSVEELLDALKDLKKQGMKDLVFDLRGNGGGYLEVAFQICDELLAGDKLLVYTEGSKSPRQDLKASRKGSFEQGKLVVLIDEYSASASEIVSGAIQDWDRGVLIGRRSFGKGLVQRPMNLPDGSQIRLTTSRYYTPSGRCIQKSYANGIEDYYSDYAKRYKHGEFRSADSISFPDSLRYYTNNGRTVYGGGGIMPDVFVPMDTSRASDYLINLRSKGVFNSFAVKWAENNREKIMKAYPTFETFDTAYDKLNIMPEFEQYAKSEGVERNDIKKEWVNQILMDFLKQQTQDSTTSFTSYQSYAQSVLNSQEFTAKVDSAAQSEDKRIAEMTQRSDKFIYSTLKAILARNLYGLPYYYKVMKADDEYMSKAIEVINNKKEYERLLKPLLK
ncbi:MAG: PDZ domain-containing protein [Bacteroidales bacterium]|jgi:carboxyl-terminal processing protease|nr:PDZ domain-containing protein [Bacteroidales bacterium]